MTVADKEYLHLIADTTFEPVFILGDHRSGTTLLYDLLRRTGKFNIVIAYHVFCFNELLRNQIQGRTENAIRELERHFDQLGITDRGIDKMLNPAHLPEEYGYFLKGGNKLKHSTLPSFNEGCRKIQFVSDLNKPLLLKNPWDYGKNFLAVKQYFPSAPIIFIHRNPVDVMNSKLNALRTMANQAGETSYSSTIINLKRRPRPFRRLALRLLFASQSQYNPGPSIIGKSTLQNARYYMEHVGELDSSSYHVVKYEDLCEKPGDIIQDTLDFLGYKARSDYDFSTFVNKRPANISPGILRYLSRNAAKFQPYCEQFNYALPI